MRRVIVDTDSSGAAAWPSYDAYYTGLNSAVAGEQATLTDDLTIECYGTASDTTAVSVSGYTLGSYTFTIKQHDDHAHGGVWSDSKYRLSVGGTSFPLRLLTTQDITIDGLQVEQTSTASHSYDTVTSTGDGVVIKNCYIRTHSANNYCACAEVTGTTSIVTRSILHSVGTGGVGATGSLCSYCVAIGGYIPFYSNRSVEYCIGIDGSHATYGVFNTSGTADYNVTDASAAAGTTNYVSSWTGASTLFPNAASGDFTPATPYTTAFSTTWGAGAIPYSREYTVDTNSGTYTTLSSALSTAQTAESDLATANETLTISCTDTSAGANPDITAATVSGFTTAENNNITISGDGWDGNYKLSPTSGDALTIGGQHVNLYDFQISGSSSTTANLLDVDQASTGARHIKNCRLTGSKDYGISFRNDDPSLVVENCLIDNVRRGVYSVSQGDGNQIFRNCTVTNFGDFGMLRGVFVNCISCDTSGTSYLQAVTGSSNNISNDTSGSSGLQSISPTNLFNNFSGGDYSLKNGSAAIGAGTSLAHLFDSDLQNNFRYGWDIGAFEWNGVYTVDTDTSSGDYPSLSAAVAALPTLLDRPTTIQCAASTGAPDTTAVTVSGVTTDATKNLTISGDGYDGNYELSINGFSDAVKIGISNVTISNMRIANTDNGQGTSGVESSSSASNVLISGCHVTGCNGTAINNLGGSWEVRNTIVDDCTGLAANAQYAFASPALTLNNCTVYNTAGIGGGASTTCNNVIAVSNTTDFAASIAGNHNIDSDGTAPGATTYTSTAAIEFTAPGSDYSIKDTNSAAYQAGTDLSAFFTDDITGATR